MANDTPKPTEINNMDLVECKVCGANYDGEARKYRHSCPYCTGDVGALKPYNETGWTDEAIVEHLKRLGYGHFIGG